MNVPKNRGFGNAAYFLTEPVYAGLRYRDFGPEPFRSETKEFKMKKVKALSCGLLVLLGCAFLFTACPTGVTEDADGLSIARTALVNPAALADPPPVYTVPVTLPTTDTTPVYKVYYNLATGARVLNPSGTNWDFGVEYQVGGGDLKDSGLVFFYTNSGVSATTGGNGRVWYTEETDFDTTDYDDGVDPDGTEYEDYATDVTRYAESMGYKVYEVPMNMMTYFGFCGGDGLTDETAFEANPYDYEHPDTYKIYEFDKMAAYDEGKGGMPPDFKSTGWVYIIRHANGVNFSKLQVQNFALNPTTLGYSMTLEFTDVTPPPPGR